MIPIPITKKTNDAAQKLYEAIEDHFINKSQLYDWAEVNHWVKCTTQNQFSFKDVVTASPLKLKKIQAILPPIAHHLRYSKYQSDLKNKRWFPTKYLYNSNFSSSTDCIGKSIQYSSIDLMNATGVTVCPYCNRQYINNSYKKRTSQLDHFYSKDKYPLLALSFYNLIPSCSSCNHTKHNNEFYKSPYEINDQEIDVFTRFSYETLGTDYYLNENDLIIKIQESKYSKIKEKDKHKNILSLDTLYEIHKDYLQELFRRDASYNKHYQNALETDFPDLNIEETLRTIWGNYLRKDLIGKRPLAKLTRDILKDLCPDIIKEVDKTIPK